MSSYDLYYPKEKYSEMEKNLHAASDSLTSKARQAERSTDRSVRISATGYRNQRDRYISAITELRKEKVIQESVYRYTTEKGARIDREKNSWFSHGQWCLGITEILNTQYHSPTSCFGQRERGDFDPLSHRTLYTTSLSPFAYGLGLLCSTDPDIARSRDTRLPYAHVLR